MPSTPPQILSCDWSHSTAENVSGPKLPSTASFVPGKLLSRVDEVLDLLDRRGVRAVFGCRRIEGVVTAIHPDEVGRFARVRRDRLCRCGGESEDRGRNREG